MFCGVCVARCGELRLAWVGWMGGLLLCAVIGAFFFQSRIIEI